MGACLHAPITDYPLARKSGHDKPVAGGVHANTHRLPTGHEKRELPHTISCDEVLQIRTGTND